MRHGSIKHLINEYPKFMEELNTMDTLGRGPLPGRVVPDSTGMVNGMPWRPAIREVA